MIIGDPAVFALESGITHAFERPYFEALGYFLIHIAGQCYGVRAPDATMLGNSLGEVEQRLADRGKHIEFYAADADAGEIADVSTAIIYDPDTKFTSFFGLPEPEFTRLHIKSKVNWAPDGDEAFDDGSRVLQYDLGDHVRLIGFDLGPTDTSYTHNPATLSDLRLDSDHFYDILYQWSQLVVAEWDAMPKSPDDYWKSEEPV